MAAWSASVDFGAHPAVDRLEVLVEGWAWRRARVRMAVGDYTSKVSDGLRGTSSCVQSGGNNRSYGCKNKGRLKSRVSLRHWIRLRV